MRRTSLENPVAGSTSWKHVAAVAAVPLVAGLLHPALRGYGWFIALMQFSVGALIAIGVGSTVVGFANSAGYLPHRGERKERRHVVRRVYRSQLHTGFAFTVVLAVGLGYGAWSGRFSAMGGWVLLPVVFIAPVLHLLGWLKKRTALREGREKKKRC